MFNLTYLDRFDIKNKEAGLTEPSGLVLGHDGDGLWTISDDTEKVFRLSLDGDLKQGDSFDVPDNGLEGITIDPAGKFLFTVREETNEVIKLDIAGREVADRRRLADMDGYGAVAHFFEDESENKGLEGIAWCEHSETLFAMKEGDPGLLLEVAPDLGSISSHAVLDRRNGFVDPGTGDEKVDYSGICYDPTRKAFWIVSDKAKRLYLYDRGEDRVRHSVPLAFARKGKYREVEKAEGVAFDPGSGRLYVVSDEEVKLYVFDVRT